MRDWGGVQVNGSNIVIMLVRLRWVDVWGVNCDSVEGDESNWFGRDRDMAMDLRGEICLAKCERHCIVMWECECMSIRQVWSG